MLCFSLQSPNFQRNKEEFPASLEKLRQLIEEEVHILESSIVDQVPVNGKTRENLPPINVK